MSTKAPDDTLDVNGFRNDSVTVIDDPTAGARRVAETALENPPDRPPRGPRWFNPGAGGVVVGLVVALIVTLIAVAPVRRILFGSGPSVSPAPGTMVWSVRMGSSSLIVLISEPQAREPVVMAVPAQTSVDLPGGGPGTIGGAGMTPGLSVAGAQATLNIRVPHYLVINESDLQALVDRLNGIQVDVEAQFASGSQILGPGVIKLLGTDVGAYLSTATDPDDLTARWEDVLTGLFAGPTDQGLWTFPLGQSDDVSRAAKMLAAAHGAAVTELPTAPSDGALVPDVKAIAALVQKYFAPAGAPLVRVIVLNGTGRSGMGAAIEERLSPLGYRVVAAQNAPSYRTHDTEVVAGDGSFLPQAEQVVAALGVGKVYVGVQPTGIADVTIIVGKDFGRH